MGFAAGFAAGYEAVTKRKELEEKRKKEEEDKRRAIKEAETKALEKTQEVSIKHQDKLLDTQLKLSEAKDITSYNAIIDAHNNYQSGYEKMLGSVSQNLPESSKAIVGSMDFSKGTRLSEYTIKNTKGEDVTVNLPEGLDNDIENLRLMDNNRVGMITVDNEGKENGVQDINLTPYQFKQDKESYSNAIDVIDKSTGKWKRVLPKDYYGNEDKYSKYEPPKQGNVTNVVVKNFQEAQDWTGLSKKSRELLNKYNSGEKLSPEEIDFLDSSDLAFEEKLSTDEKKKKEEILSSLNTLEDVKTLRKDVQKLIDSGIDGGIAQKVIVGAMKYVGSGGTFSDLTGMSREKFKEITGFDSADENLRMTIIKELSGLQYTDKQANAMSSIVGSIWGGTTEYKANALDGYIKQQEDALRKYTKSDNLFSRKSAYTSYRISEALDKGKNSNKKETKSTESKTTEQPKEDIRIINGKKYKKDSNGNIVEVK